ncbi:MAG: DUF499 domain-containing protein [Dehalococcoidia bacterium]
MAALQPWWKVVTPRKEVREGRSFNPDEFAIALEQVIAGTAPDDYKDPRLFFERTVFTRALREHAGMALRRLAGETADTAPVLTLITQFGGGKTHTLTTLYHLVRLGADANALPGVASLLESAQLDSVPAAKVAAFVGNAWDPAEGRETPWIDVARQLAGPAGVEALGETAKTTAPGTEAIGRLFEAAGGRVLILCDEVLNFLSRYRDRAESFRDFLQNLTVAATGTPSTAVVISLPRSQVEMADWDMEWQERITKIVRRVAKDLIVNDESEISEVVRRRLFESLGDGAVRAKVAAEYASWCFERRAQLPPEWTAIDSSATEKKAREFLRDRFERCYPFHPATLSVFQRKWQALPQYQQTRGTLAMLAQWVARAYKDGFTSVRAEPLLTLGSAPLEAPEFRGIVLGQLGESRLVAAIDADIAGETAHSRALDADTPRGPLRDIHRRVATSILFESSGGQADKTAHLPELRFALGEPGIDTTSIDTAAGALDSRSFFIRKVGSDGYRIGYKPKLSKVVSDRRASLDEEADVRPEMRRIIEKEFDRGATLSLVTFPKDSSEIQDSPRLTIVVAEPDWEWNGASALRERIAEWTRQRGNSDRLYPAALVWCVRRTGRDLRDKVELLLAWRRVQREVQEGTLGSEFERSELTEIQAKVRDAEEAAKDEVWAGYRYVVLLDKNEADGLKVIDLGAGHASASETLCGRMVTALKSGGLLNESVGAGYIDRNWPPALVDSGAWPLSSLRQAFLNGSFTRLLDPDAVLRTKVAEFVERGEFGLASSQHSDGTYDRVWFEQAIATDEVAFEAGVFLLTKAKAVALKGQGGAPPALPLAPAPGETTMEEASPVAGEQEPAAAEGTRTIRLVGNISPEVWNRFGTKILPKLRSAVELRVGVELSVVVDAKLADQLEADLRQILEDVGVSDSVRLE